MSKIKELMTASYVAVSRPKWLISLMSIIFVLSSLYPSDLDSYKRLAAGQSPPAVVHHVENYARYINTGLQVAIPIILADKIGMMQFAYIAVSATIATHVLKRLLNDWIVMGSRLGQRPGSDTSKHNMPSGHASMASCAAYFVCRRYGIQFSLVMFPILILTGYARIMLDSHTISAVISGTLLGFISAAIFTSKRAVTREEQAIFVRA
jgi:membrane-associated phospholipid phosphatase